MEREYLTKRKWALPRPHINKMMDTGLQYPFITVLAGPGYGKTTAVLDFCRDTKHKVIWMHLLPMHNNPDNFWDLFTYAHSFELPQLAQSLSNMDFPDSSANFGAFLRVSHEAAKSIPKTILVLDNAENIQNERIRQFVNNLISVEFDKLSIILISNEKLHLHAGNEGKCFVIGADDLRFNQSEISELFEQNCRILKPEEIIELEEYTEGWPLALHLIASHMDVHSKIERPEITCGQIIDELFEENFFSNYDETLKKLLIKLSLLQSVYLPLVQTLNQKNDNQRAIEELSKNLFITYDHIHKMYFFHNMYRNFLMRKQSMMGDEITELYSNVGDWYLQNGFYRDAYECYWYIRDYDRFYDAVLLVQRKRKSRDTTNQLLNKLNQIPEEYSEANAGIDFFRAFAYLNNAQVRKAKEIFLSLTERLESSTRSPRDETLLGDSYAALTNISFYQGNLDAMKYAEKAVLLLPDGTRNRTDDTFAVGNNDTFFLPDNAAGSFDKVMRYNHEYALIAEKLYNKSGRGFPYLFAAEGCYYVGRMDDAQEHSIKAISVANNARQYDIAANAMYLQMRIALFEGNYTKAEDAHKTLINYIDDTKSITLTELRDCANGIFYLQTRNYEKVPQWQITDKDLSMDIPLEIGRDRLIYAVVQYIKENYDKAYTALLDLDDIFTERNLWSIRVSANILKAVCFLRTENIPKAIAALWLAYDMTWKNNIFICFSEFGQEMLTLLDAVANQDEFLFDHEWMKHVGEMSAEYSTRGSAMIKQSIAVNNAGSRQPLNKYTLTGREKEVLIQIAKGLTRKEIGSILGISVHGVKKHITNIYTKLGAMSRMEVIQIAVANGFVDLEPSNKTFGD